MKNLLFIGVDQLRHEPELYFNPDHGQWRTGSGLFDATAAYLDAAGSGKGA